MFDNIPQKVKELFMIILSLVSSKFTGHIEIHFNNGGICRGDKKEKII